MKELTSLGCWSLELLTISSLDKSDIMNISESHLIFLDLQQSQLGPDLCLLVLFDGEANFMAVGEEPMEPFLLTGFNGDDMDDDS